MPSVKYFESKVKYLAKQSGLRSDIKTLKGLTREMGYDESCKSIWNYYFDKARSPDARVEFSDEHIEKLLKIFKLSTYKTEFCEYSSQGFQDLVLRLTKLETSRTEAWDRLFGTAQYDLENFRIVPQNSPELGNHRRLEEPDDDELLDTYTFLEREFVQMSINGPKDWSLTLLERSPKYELTCLRPSRKRPHLVKLTGAAQLVPEDKAFRVSPGVLGQFVCLAILTKAPLGAAHYCGLFDESNSVRNSALNDVAEYLNGLGSDQWKALWRAYQVVDDPALR